MTKLACLETFGCQMNRLDSELIRSLLEEEGYAFTRNPEEADLVLFNTCSVRKSAENRVYGRLAALRRLKADRPDVVIAVLGCMAQKDREGIFAAEPHVDIVCGTREFPALLEYVERVRQGETHIVATGLPAKALAKAGEQARIDSVFAHRRLRPGQFHAYVSVMRGCDNWCSYCIVPSVRGREVSRPAADVVEEVRRLVDAGVVEVTLLGQNISSYGRNLKGETLATLLGKVAAVPGLRRLWFITSHPADVTREVFDCMHDLSNVMPYLHMPAQSGSTAVLERMNRGYARERYVELVGEAKAAVPGVAIASDFIVGFPGETQGDFDQTVSLIEACRFASSFIFKYSPRPGTKAATLADDVPQKLKEERNRRLLAVQERISAEENAAFVGRTVEVLIEGPSKRRKDRLTGRARDHRIVIIDGASISAGTVVTVSVTRATALALYGTAAGQPK